MQQTGFETSLPIFIAKCKNASFKSHRSFPVFKFCDSINKDFNINLNKHNQQTFPSSSLIFLIKQLTRSSLGIFFVLQINSKTATIAAIPRPASSTTNTPRNDRNNISTIDMLQNSMINSIIINKNRSLLITTTYFESIK